MRWQLLRFPIHPRDGSTLVIEKVAGNAFGGLAPSGVHLGKRVRRRQFLPVRAAKPCFSAALMLAVTERLTMQIKMAILSHG